MSRHTSVQSAPASYGSARQLVHVLMQRLCRALLLAGFVTAGNGHVPDHHGENKLQPEDHVRTGHMPEKHRRSREDPR